MVARLIRKTKQETSTPEPAKGRYRAAFEQGALPQWLCDTELRLLEVNDALCELLRRPSEELLGRNLPEFTHSDELRLDGLERAEMLSGAREHCTREKQLLRAGDDVVWALVATRLVRDADGTPLYFVGQAAEVTEHHLREQRLRQLADHDPLTGLVNRRGFGRELRRHISRLARYGAKGALLMVDLDNFKGYNDAHGHAGGDVLLQAVANSLNDRLRAGDVLGRIGGDEFAVLLPEVTPEEAEVVAAALVQAVRELEKHGSPTVTASVGIFCFGQDQALSEHHAMVGADLAMYAAKHAGRDRYAPLGLWTSAPASPTM
jgi:diguanylate cyclase (GGDEF)-like protein/PAS domain S-box-containing protein